MYVLKGCNKGRFTAYKAMLNERRKTIKAAIQRFLNAKLMHKKLSDKK